MPANWFVMGVLFLMGVPTAIADDSTFSVSPDPEFLEFLGTWETEDGEWIDPIGLADMESMPERPGGGGDRPSTSRGGTGFDRAEEGNDPFALGDDDRDE